MLRNRFFTPTILVFSAITLSACAQLTPTQSAKNSAEQSKPAETQQKTTPQQALNTNKEAPVVTATSPSNSPLLAEQVTPASPAVTTAPVLTAEVKEKSIDVWQRIRNGYAMPEQNSKLIPRFEQWYANRPEYVERMTERAQRYMYYIIEEVEKRGMPTEIALLPMIESAFNPGAYSSARASGIWQFIPSTGKHFGMQQNWWYDGRRDVINATNGALDYLEKLHKMFGSWDLALAAYNAGENSVMRAQARNRKRKLPTNYASLKLPKETIQYVPKLLAVKNIISNPERYGLTLTDIPSEPYFAEVTVNRHIDVNLAAELAEISMDEFMALNPAHNRPVILQKEDEVILLPVQNVAIFNANLENANRPLVSWQACPTKKGESLDSIASRYDINIEKLRTVNGLHKSIQASNGQTLLVPLNGEQAESEFTAFNTHLPPTDNRLLNAIKHVVRKGDTLGAIARRYHVKLSSLKSWNRNVKIIRPGQHILVAQPAKKISTAKAKSTGKRNIQRVTTKKRSPARPEKM